MLRESKWKVVCQVCGRVILNTVAKKRWDGIITCPNDWEEKHPSLSYRHRHRGAGGEGSIPSGGIHTGNEDTSQSVLVCDVYTSMGVVGYGTTGCARTGTYNSALPLPVPINTPEIPYIDPALDPFFADVIFLSDWHNDFGDDSGNFTVSAFGSPSPINHASISGAVTLFGRNTLRITGVTNDIIKYDVPIINPILRGNYSLLVEGFFYPLSFPATVNFIINIQQADTTQNTYIYMSNTGVMNWLSNGVTSTIGTCVLNQWNYFAMLYNPVSIENGLRRIWFSNGSTTIATLLVNTASQASSLEYQTTSRLNFGARDVGGNISQQMIDGYLSEFRITASGSQNINRYGSDSTILIPTEPFPRS